VEHFEEVGNQLPFYNPTLDEQIFVDEFVEGSETE
jgi:hypothetical protein